MRGSALPRTQLFADEPVGELRGLATLTDPDDAAAVIDLAVIGARGDGKTQFIVHAIRAMHAHAPALDGAEQVLNRDVLRLVLDPRAMVAINRWAVVDPICARGALRDEVVSVASSGRGEAPSPPRAVAREQVRANCLDAEDGRDQDVRLAYLRYDTAIKTQVDVDSEAGAITYAYDDGPGAFSGGAATRFLDWVIGLVRWPAARHEAATTTSASAAAATSALGSVPPTGPVAAPTAPPPLSAPLVPVASPMSVTLADSDVWARPQDLPGAQ
jgi:hypothetical protein